MSYCDIDNAYQNNSTELDKLAHKLNNEKKQLVKAVYKDHKKSSQQLDDGMSQILQMTNSGLPNFGQLYSRTGGSLISDINSSNSEESKFSEYNHSFGLSDDMSMVSDIDPTLDTYLDKAKKDKKKNKKNDLHALVKKIADEESCSSNSNETIFDHIKKCKNCKIKLMNMINKKKNQKNNKHIFDSESDNIYEILNNKTENNDNLIKGISNNKLKEVLIVILIGIFAIILLDLFFRRRK